MHSSHYAAQSTDWKGENVGKHPDDGATLSWQALNRTLLALIAADAAGHDTEIMADE